MAAASLNLRAALLSVCLLALGLVAWHLAVSGGGTAVEGLDPEYAALMGAQVTEGASAMPGPLDLFAMLWSHLSDPFYDNGPNSKGIGLQLLFSLGRVLLGFSLAFAVAVPLGFLIGMSPLVSKALDPFIQIMKPVSPLAWMPLALYTIKDSAISSIFVIFICSIWPMLVNTAFRRLVEARQDVEHRSLAAARVTDDADELAAFDRQPHVLEDRQLAFALPGVALGDPLDRDQWLAHRRPRWVRLRSGGRATHGENVGHGCTRYSGKVTRRAAAASSWSRIMPIRPIIRIATMTLTMERLFHSFQTK